MAEYVPHGLNVTELFARGAYGSLYLLSDGSAMKVVRSDNLANEFLHKYLVLTKLKLNQKYVLLPKKITPKEDSIVMIMDYAKEGDLKQLIKRKYEFTVTEMLQVALGINELHKERIIYGDVKPANFVKDGDCIRLIDFDCIEMLSEDLEVENGIEYIECSGAIGTISYLAPESFERLSLPSDVFSCGVSFFEMLTGQTLLTHPVLGARTLGELCSSAEDWLHDNVSLLLKTHSHINKIVQALIIQMLSLDPTKRPKINQVCDILQSLTGYKIENEIKNPIDTNERFEILERTIGIGKGVIAKVKDKKLNMVAALKTYRESTVSNDLPRLIEAFKRAKEFNHPNVVRYLDYGVLEQSFENLHFVVMELAPLDLEKYILNHSVVNSDSGNERFRIGEVSQNKNREYSLSLKEVTLLFRDILKGYDYLHQNKIIHRDLKPQNILIYRVQGEIVPKISDHDECKISELDLVRTTMIQGTREYAAPELFEKHLSNNNLYETVDIYSLGCIYLFVLIKTCLEVDGKTFFDWMIVNQEEKVHNFIKERIEMLYKNTNEKIRNCIIRLLYCTIKKSPLRIPLKDFYAVIKYILSLMNHSETADLYEDVINDSLMEEILKKNEK